MKTANELAQEYFAKTPMERLHTTLQDYVYDYMQKQLNVQTGKISLALNYIENTNDGYISFKYELSNILKHGNFYGGEK